MAGVAFREQVLNSARNALDDLAKTFVTQVNSIHKASMDAYGNPGEATHCLGSHVGTSIVDLFVSQWSFFIFVHGVPLSSTMFQFGILLRREHAL